MPCASVRVSTRENDEETRKPALPGPEEVRVTDGCLREEGLNLARQPSSAAPQTLAFGPYFVKA